MSDLPIKGQETLFTLTSPGGLEETVDKIKDASFTFEMELITEQYLNEVADQYDDIFRGCGVELTFNLRSAKTFDLVERIISRAQRRSSANEKFSVCSTLRFPNGERRRMLFPDLKFAEIPTSLGARDEYAEMKFSMKCSSYRKL